MYSGLFGVAKVLLRQQKWQEAETILKESVNILHPTTSAGVLSHKMIRNDRMWTKYEFYLIVCIAIRDLNYCLRMLKKDQEAVDILQHQRVVSYHQGIHSFTYELPIILAGNFCINCAVVTFLILNEQTIQIQFALAKSVGDDEVTCSM